MTYTVTYKLERAAASVIKKVKGDGFLETGSHRWFVCDDETRYEIPVSGTTFKFSKDRFLVIKQDMERRAGQKLPVGD